MTETVKDILKLLTSFLAEPFAKHGYALKKADILKRMARVVEFVATR